MRSWSVGAAKCPRSRLRCCSMKLRPLLKPPTFEPVTIALHGEIRAAQARRVSGLTPSASLSRRVSISHLFSGFPTCSGGPLMCPRPTWPRDWKSGALRLLSLTGDCSKHVNNFLTCSFVSVHSYVKLDLRGYFSLKRLLLMVQG